MGISEETKEKMIELYKKGVKLKDIADQCNVSLGSVSSFISSKKIANRHKKADITEEMKQDFNTMYRKGYSIAKIADKYKIQPKQVKKYLINYESKTGRKSLKKEEIEAIRKDYYSGILLTEISKKYNINVNTIYSYVDSSKRPKLSRKKVKRVRKLSPEQIEQMADLYLKGERIVDIAATFDVSKNTITYHLKERGIKRQRPNPRSNAKQIVKEWENGIAPKILAEKFNTSERTIQNIIIER